MKINALFIFCLFFTLACSAQNLIKNGDFEIADSLFAEDWIEISGTPDHFHPNNDVRINLWLAFSDSIINQSALGIVLAFSR